MYLPPLYCFENLELFYTEQTISQHVSVTIWLSWNVYICFKSSITLQLRFNYSSTLTFDPMERDEASICVFPLTLNNLNMQEICGAFCVNTALIMNLQSDHL